MSTDLSGFFSNAYAYLDLIEEDSFTRDLVSNAVGALGEVLGNTAFPGLGGVIGEAMGEFAGDQAFTLISNASRIAENVETFGAEVSDWRSWGSAMSRMGGGSVGSDSVSSNGSGVADASERLPGAGALSQMGFGSTGLDALISNASQITSDAQSFTTEINDWRSGATMPQMGTGFSGLGFP